ncbi:MAG: Ig-like domain-containing protein [Chloroflexi bacterium]|nr:Ig-like domain-containing protein [Chloroflexota bacterium]
MKRIKYVLFYLFLLLLISCQPLEPAKLTVDVIPTGPQVVDQSPFPSERLVLEPTLMVRFDRKMDRASVEAAWTLRDGQDQPVAGTTSWADDSTFQFKPKSKLQPGSAFTGVFSASATSANGTPLTEELRFNYMTVDALSVSQVFPGDGAKDIAPDTAITIIFNKPVVPVSIMEERENQPHPITIYPAISGTGEWVNSSVYVFQPEKPLTSQTQYKVNLRKGLVDVTGSELSDSYSWTFSTTPPKILHYSLVNGERNPTELVKYVRLDQAFEIEFAQPMNEESVAESLSLVNREMKTTIPLDLTWNEKGTLVTIKPHEAMKIASFYDLVLTDSARAADSGTLAQGLTLKISTVPLPQILGTDPQADSKASRYSSRVTINFASPMDIKSFEGKIQISPEVKDFKLYYDDYSWWSMTLDGFMPSTEYVVRILPGMRDIYGNEIKTEYAFSFTTGSRDPSAYMLLPYDTLVYREQGKQEMYFQYINAKNVNISVYQLSPEEFTRYQGDNSSSPVFFDPASRSPILTWTPDSEIELDAIRRVRIDFAELGGPLKAGYYLIGLQADPFTHDGHFLQANVFVVATDNLTFKTTDTEALAWLVDLETGEPVSNVPVSVYDRYWNKLKTVNTSKDGLAYFANVNNPVYVRAEGNGHLAYATRYWGSGVSFGEFGVWTAYYGDVSGPFAYVYTDRPLYRPGQEVLFKGIVREQDDLRYSLTDHSKVYVKILNSQGEEVYKDTLNISSDMGTFDAKFNIAKDAMVGTYDMFVGYDFTNPFASVSFRVAEYRKPEFEVNASAASADVLAGDPITFNLDAAYYSGGNLSNANADWFTEASSYSFIPVEDYANFSFSDLNFDWYRYNASQPSGGTLNEGTGQTDAQGHFSVQQPSSLGEDNISRRVTFNANITDVAGNLVSGSTSVVVHQSKVYAGIRPMQYLGTQGEPQSFEVVALDWNSVPQAGATVRVEMLKQEWFSVQKQGKDGRLSWETSMKETPVETKSAVVVDEKGLAQVQFTPPTGGIYKVMVTVDDGAGHTHKASTRIWVAGKDFVPWRETNDRSFDLVADKAEYAPGDTAKILIASPFEQEVYALVSYERGHVYEREVVLLKGNSTIYELPITKDMAPGVYLSVTVIRGAQQGGLDFKMGVTQFKVNTSQQELNVTVTPDQKTAGPGDTLTYTVQTKDASGKPVAAEVSLALVDKSVLALAPSNTQPILSAFYPQRALSVQTSVGIVQNAEDFNANYEGTETDGQSSGSGGGGKGAGDLGVIDVRQNFKDTAYFRAVVQTDESGTATVSVTLPDNLTTWRMDARAVTADSRVGQSTSELVSTKPVFIQIQAPRFFVVNDAAQLGATVHNNTDVAMQVTVSLDARGVTMKSEAVHVVDVPARGQVYVTWDVEVKPDSTRVDLLASASGGGYEDRTQPTLGTLDGNGIPVYAYRVSETVGTSGILTTANSASEAFVLPTSMKGQDATLMLEVSPSLAASMTDDLTYLKDYPYLCMEQTVSRFLPNVLSTHVLKMAGIESPLSKDLDANVGTALQRIYAKQNSDGGWGWWNMESHPLTSAYIVLGLVEARDAGYTVSESVISRGISYLQSRLPQLHVNSSTSDYNRQTFMLFVLARADHAHENQMNFVFEHREKLSVYAQAYLAHAMFLADPKDERITTLLADINGTAIVSSTGTHWQEKTTDYWNWNTDKRTTAIVLNMLTDVDPKNPLTANAVRWVMSNRKGGRFDSTQETAWTLMALTNWLKVTGELQSSYQYAIGLNGDLLQQGEVTKDNLSDPIVVKKALLDEVNTLVVSRDSGKGNLYYSAYLDVSLPVDQVNAYDHGIAVSRQYYAVDDLDTPITEIQRGELVQVRVTIVVPESLHYMVVNDPLPAGLEGVDSSLMTSAEVPTSLTRTMFKQRGWGWWYFDYIGMQDEKVVLSAEYLPAGTYVFNYLARASTAGTFNVIPVTAQEFYFPDVAGRGDGSVFVVKP